MSNRSLLKRLLALLMLISLTTTYSYAQEDGGVDRGEKPEDAAAEKKDDTYEDKKPEQILHTTRAWL